MDPVKFTVNFANKVKCQQRAPIDIRTAAAESVLRIQWVKMWIRIQPLIRWESGSDPTVILLLLNKVKFQ